MYIYDFFDLVAIQETTVAPPATFTFCLSCPIAIAIATVES